MFSFLFEKIYSYFGSTGENELEPQNQSQENQQKHEKETKKEQNNNNNNSVPEWAKNEYLDSRKYPSLTKKEFIVERASRKVMKIYYLSECPSKNNNVYQDLDTILSFSHEDTFHHLF